METNLDSQIIKFIEIAAYFGLIFFTTVFVSFNHKTFKAVFKQSAKSYWWFFMIISIIPLVILLSIFSLIFERKSPIKRIISFKDGRPVMEVNRIEFSKIEEISPSEAFVQYFKNKNKKDSAEFVTPTNTEIKNEVFSDPLPTTVINFQKE